MKKLLSLVFVFSLLLGVSGCGSDSKDSKKLQVATVAPYFPYEMISTEGEYEGFDIELMEIIAEKLGYEGVEWQNLEFDASLLAIQNGDVDMGIAGYSPTPDRKKKWISQLFTTKTIQKQTT